MLSVLMFQRLLFLMTMSWVLESSKSTQRQQISTDLTHTCRSMKFMYHFNKGSHVLKARDILKQFFTYTHILAMKWPSPVLPCIYHYGN